MHMTEQCKNKTSTVDAHITTIRPGGSQRFRTQYFTLIITLSCAEFGGACVCWGLI